MALRTAPPNNLAAARKAFRRTKLTGNAMRLPARAPGDAYRGLWATLHEYRE
jgi:hypothetical protein